MPDSENRSANIPQNISTEIFIKNWAIYKKIIENDNMSHSDGYAKLREILMKDMKRPFSFLDLACGDAYYSSKVLEDTKAVKYIGIDVSAEALSFAKEELRNSGFESTFIRADFFDFDKIIEKPVDVVWVGFSVHHLETADKLEFMKKVKKALSSDGLFIVYEPILWEGENQGSYYERFKETFYLHWTGLSKEETESLLEHVRESEKPETAEDWIKLGKEAGFNQAEKVFSEKTGLYELFKFK
jgi:ubiquinone/menaquinone biosynthesis C-methylase UbiE